MDILRDKVCIVTGAGQGIGKAIAMKFIEEGAHVFACDKTDGSMDEYKKNLDSDLQERFHTFYLDICDTPNVRSMVKKVFDEHKKIDVLINNAGVVFNRRIGMISREETELMFKINVIALIDLVQIVSRFMSKNRAGSIVNMASVTAVQGSPGQSAYSATKGAVISFTRSAAKELASMGIRVNAVAPGIVETERFKELYEINGDKIDERISHIALKRLGTPVDIANACCFLASDYSSYISGQVLGVDGCASI